MSEPTANAPTIPDPRTPAPKTPAKYSEKELIRVLLEQPEWAQQILEILPPASLPLFLHSDYTQRPAQVIEDYFTKHKRIPPLELVKESLLKEVTAEDWEYYEEVLTKPDYRSVPGIKAEFSEWARTRCWGAFSNRLLESIHSRPPQYEDVETSLAAIREVDSALCSGLQQMPKACSIADAIKDVPPTEFVVGGLIPKGKITLLHGAAKTGKSYVSLFTGLCVASGQPLASFLQAPAAFKTLYVSMEDDPSDHKPRVEGILKTRLDLDPSKLLVRYRSDFKEPIDLRETARPLIQAVKADEIQFLILDPLNYLHTSKENDAGEMSRVYDRLNEIIDKTGASILLLHHSRKAPSGTDGGDAIDRARGSSVITSRPRCVMEWRYAAPGVSNVTVRGNSTNITGFSVKWDRVSGSVEVCETLQPRQDAVDFRKQVLEALTKCAVIATTGVSQAQIQDHLDGLSIKKDRKTIYAALGDLVAWGQAKEVGKGKHGSKLYLPVAKSKTNKQEDMQ